jgi:hypothetical protein
MLDSEFGATLGTSRDSVSDTSAVVEDEGEGGQEEEDEGRDGGGAVAVVLYALPDGSQIKDDWERAVDGSTEASEQLVPGISVLE